MEKVPEDIDIGTNATPEEIKALYPKSDMSHADFGSVRIGAFEITTFREDDQVSNGRHPEAVIFSSREKDAPRRDITINAMYWHPISSELYDPFHGENDLTERLIRIIGNPDERIEHDSLRLLRVIRFRALVDGQYHPETFQALHRNAKKITILSGTRRLNELEKMLMGPNPDRALEDLWETDVLEEMIPELHACKGVGQPADFHHEGDVWDHTMMVTRAFMEDHQADVRLAALLHDTGKTTTFALKERIRFDEHASASADLAKKALDRLQCPVKRREKICWLIAHHMMMGAFHDPEGKQEMPEEKKADWYYHPWFTELLQIFWLDIAGTDPADYSLYDAIVTDYHRYLDSHPRPPKPLLTGEDVMEILGIPPGERVGKILKQVYEKQVRGEIASKADATEFVRHSVRK